MVDGLARDARRGGFTGLGGFGHYVDFFQAEGALRQHIILSDTPFDGDFFRYVLVPDELDDQLVGSRVQALEGIVAFGVGGGIDPGVPEQDHGIVHRHLDSLVQGAHGTVDFALSLGPQRPGKGQESGGKQQQFISYVHYLPIF